MTLWPYNPEAHTDSLGWGVLGDTSKAGAWKTIRWLLQQ